MLPPTEITVANAARRPVRHASAAAAKTFMSPQVTVYGTIRAVLLACLTAAAQEVPPDATATPIEGVVLEPPAPAPPPAPVSYTRGFAWRETGPRSVAGISDVAVHPALGELWVVATEEGAAWVSVDGGDTWLEVLGPAAGQGEEDVAGEIEARLREVGTTVDVPDESSYEDGGTIDADELEQALQDAADAARDASQQAVDDLQSELEGDDAWFLSARRQSAVRPRVWFTSQGLLVVARTDGLRVSPDLGTAWTLVLEEPVTALAELPDGRFVVGTPHGLLATPGLTQFTPVSGFETVAIRDLTEDDGVYAATSDGLWFSPDLFVWRRLSGWLDDVATVRPVRAGDGSRAPRALVLGAEDDLWRALDPVASPANGVFGGPVPRSTSVVRRDDALMIAASALGPFESTDAGGSWTPLPRGLPDGADARDVELVGDLVLLASGGGLYELVPRPEEQAPIELRLDDWVPLNALVDAGTLRPELVARSGRRWAAAVLPQVTLDGTWNQEVGDDWDADTWTVRPVDTWWEIRVKLTWRPNRQRSTSGYFDAEELAAGLDVLVFEDEVVIDDGLTSDALVSKVNRAATLYRTEVADTIAGLWTTRQRLVAERELAGDEPLVDQLARALRVAELEARLDALTDGAVSSWNNGENR